MKTAWVLSGGGAKGSFQLGVMKKLIASGQKPDVIYGTSVGALNSCGLVYGGLQELEKVWLSIKDRSDILSLNWWKLPFSTGVYSMNPLKKKIEAITKLTKDESIESVVCIVDLSTTLVSYVSNKNVTTDKFVKSVLASAAIPFVMEPVDSTLVDGGVREQTPLKKAILDGADKIVAILCNPLKKEMVGPKWQSSFPHFVSNGIRALDILEHEVYLNDIIKCLKYNSLEGKKKIDLEIYCPEYPIIDTLEFEPTKIRTAIKAGEQIGVLRGMECLA